MTKARVLLCALLAGCADMDEGGSRVDLESFEAPLIEATADAANAEHSLSEAPFERAMETCYAQTSGPGSQLEVHTVGRYLALGDTMMAVRVTIPKAPRLARCIEDAVSDSVPPGAAAAPDRLASGTFAIDLGGPPKAVQAGDIERQYEEHERGMAALMREVVERGVLPRDHPLVREVLDAESARQ